MKSWVEKHEKNVFHFHLGKILEIEFEFFTARKIH